VTGLAGTRGWLGWVALAMIALAAGIGLVAHESDGFSILKSTVLVGMQPGGYYLLPTNQLLRPWGLPMAIRGRPVDLAFDSSFRMLAVLNQNSVLLLDPSTDITISTIKIPGASYAGIAFRPGDRELWASASARKGDIVQEPGAPISSAEGTDALVVIDINDDGRPGKSAQIELPGHPVPTGIAFSADGATAYVALSRNNTVGVFDAVSRKLKQEIPTGIAPYGVALAAKYGKLFVSNRGGRRPGPGDSVAPSSGSRVISDPRTGATASGTLTVIDVPDGSSREIEVGLAPSDMAISPNGKRLAVVNSYSDSVSFIDVQELSRIDVPIPTWPGSAFGSQPTAVAFSRDGTTLYVACGGNNAVAVLESEGNRWKVTGAVPTGWFPTALVVDKAGSLRVANIKGVGNTAYKAGVFQVLEFEGSLLNIPSPNPVQLAAGMREVRAANMPKFEPAGGVVNLASLGIRHVFLIIKENRTYDQILGDIAKGNGEPKLCMYGMEVTPNQHALAEQFVLLDNFYAASAVSFDGHHWLMQGLVSDYVERALSGPRGYAYNLTDALTISPRGFFWQSDPSLAVRIHGEFSLPALWDPARQKATPITPQQLRTWSEYWQLYQEGKWQTAVGSRSGVPALGEFVDPKYPNDCLLIPDQIRAEVFLQDLAVAEHTGRLPALNIFTLPMNHTNGTRPGSPTPRAMVADNDLAVGRIVEAISRSRFWPNSLILVVEDDASNGLDHVDGRRTVALAIGPYIRRGLVDSNYYNQLSMVRTIQDIFRLVPRTHFVASARAMNSIFTAIPEFTPYRCLPSQTKLDEMNPPLAALSGRRLWAARQSLKMNFSRIDDAPADILNPILWWESKGYDTPFPRTEAATRRSITPP